MGEIRKVCGVISILLTSPFEGELIELIMCVLLLKNGPNFKIEKI